ncbi:hypothetical protein [Prochlorococcus marinus]|uniref:hypothetical protein n=1 Tax=Prochlorococcus marinus TaxID=1219 RepID=UPI0002F4F669|nr:hypothetical protein [Prochlorococcus marinus]
MTGCTSKEKVDNFKIDIPQRSNQAKALKVKSIGKITTPTETPKKNQFLKLETSTDLQSSGTFGKSDPFSEYSDSSSGILSPSLKLKGIIATEKKKFALVEYRKRSGSLEEGQIGGKTTQLLPMGVKVKRIDVANQNVTLSLKGKQYQLSYSY